MEIYIFNESRELSGIIEAYEYLRWTRCYCQSGSFELKAIATDENIALLKIGNILWKNDDEEAGIIEYSEITMREQEYITVSGRFATFLLGRRIVRGTEILNGDLSACVSQLINNHIIAPSEPDRAISDIEFTSASLGIPVNTQISYKNLMDAVTELCEASDVGIKTVFTPETKIFTIQLYIGGITQAVFSQEYENIIQQIFSQSVVDYANTALVGGAGEGSERVFVTTGGGAGTQRYEIFVDAKDLSEEDFPTNYTEALLFRGNTKLAEQAMVKSFDATINQYGNLKYKTDFNLGDMIKVVSKRWGVFMTARITEIVESYDKSGMSLGVTFGKPLLTLAQKLKGGYI